MCMGVRFWRLKLVKALKGVIKGQGPSYYILDYVSDFFLISIGKIKASYLF